MSEARVGSAFRLRMPMSTTATAWYAIFSKPRHELQVASYLSSKGIEVFHPTLRVKPVNPRASTLRSFFPRYLFIQTDLAATGTGLLQWTPGAVGLVEFDGEAAIIPDSFISEIRRRVATINAAGGIELEGLKKGDAVRITHGPFAGHDAIFDIRLSGEERVQVLLRWLGQEVRVQVKRNGIAKHTLLRAQAGRR